MGWNFFGVEEIAQDYQDFNESKSISIVHNSLQFLLEWYNFEQNSMILKNNN